jgi:ethanolamine utilization cobalamin adenosyltransferase
MSPVFIFAEQVRSIVRSGKKEIEIPEGARISSAAADLIKAHHIEIKTVAPGKASFGETAKTDDKSADPARAANRKKSRTSCRQKSRRIVRPWKIPLNSQRTNLKKLSTGSLSASNS